MSAVARVPANTESTKGAHFQTLLSSSPSVVGGAIASVAVFTLGAATHHPALMLGAPVLVGIPVLIICWFVADDKAENEFFTRYAAAHQLAHYEKSSVNSFTPLLGGGDRRHCEHWMQSNDGGNAIGWFTFEVRQDNGDKPDTWEPHHFTVAMVDLGEMGMRRFQGIYVRRKRGIFDRLDTDSNWLKKSRVRKVELESTAFDEKYELWIDQDQDDIVVRQLFAPSFIVWMTDHPLSPGFELRAGTLVVFLPGRCGEAGKLDWLLMALRDISTRVQTELTQAAQAFRPI